MYTTSSLKLKQFNGNDQSIIVYTCTPVVTYCMVFCKTALFMIQTSNLNFQVSSYTCRCNLVGYVSK